MSTLVVRESPAPKLNNKAAPAARLDQPVQSSVCGYLFYSCALCTHFTAKYSYNVFCASICTKNVQTPVLTVQVVHRCVLWCVWCMLRLCSQCDLVRFYGCINDATNICSAKCFSIFYDYTKVHDLLCDGIRIILTRAQCFNDGLTTTVR